jgi:hypothetical protein
MSPSISRSQLLLVAALATLLLRAITPEGYMPGSARSGLLFELCPEGMPAEIMRVLAGDSGHHHHHGPGEESPGSSTEQCPIGHMLASAIAVDVEYPLVVSPPTSPLIAISLAAIPQRQVVDYRSRSPPT